MFHYVYSLRSTINPDRFYIGLTRDLNKRLTKHNLGEVPSTKLYVPWQIEVAIAFRDRSKEHLEIRTLPESGRIRLPWKPAKSGPIRLHFPVISAAATRPAIPVRTRRIDTPGSREILVGSGFAGPASQKGCRGYHRVTCYELHCCARNDDQDAT
jgi:putative endonuclease